MSRPTRGLAGASLLLAVALTTGCSDPTAHQQTGPLQVTLQKIAAPSLEGVGPMLSVSGGEEAAGPIALSNIRCLYVEVIGIHLLPVVEDDPDTPEEEEAMWERLSFDEPLEPIDLRDLPEEGEDPLSIVLDPAVPAGPYRQLRFITGDLNRIFFVEGIQVGQTVYGADDSGDCSSEGHPVNVPSGSQTGLKTDIQVTVGEPAQDQSQSIDLLFDEDTSIRNAVATGSGRINLTPVLRSRP